MGKPPNPVFFVGLHQPSDAHRFIHACISINRLRKRVQPLGNVRVLVDSGAFTELERYGAYRHEPEEYAAALHSLHLRKVCNIVAAVSQDYMCEPFMLAKTGMTIEQHQRLTIERYDRIVACGLPFPVLPVLQGYSPADYVRHIHMYGNRLKPWQWVGVGSVCKRNSDPRQILGVLGAIKQARPDLQLHGFGIKLTALKHPLIRALLATSDSMAWSYHARINGRSGNDWQEAAMFVDKVHSLYN
jgi:hypothetical protein